MIVSTIQQFGPATFFIDAWNENCRRLPFSMTPYLSWIDGKAKRH
jgi:hypothetical protein